MNLQEPKCGWKHHLPAIALLLGVSLFILGTKLGQIFHYASIVPLLDDWRIPEKVLLPWLQGTLTWDSLFDPHNEHRIVFVRLLSLLIFIFNENQWDVWVGMTVNAVMLALTIAIPIFLALRGFAAVPAALIAAMIWSVPNAIYWNTAFYFGMAWYWYVFLSVLAFCLYAESLSARWYGSVAFAFAAFFTVAGVAPLIVLTTIELTRFFKSPRSRLHFFLSASLTTSLLLVCASLTSVVRPISSLVPASAATALFYRVPAIIGEFINGLSWPVIGSSPSCFGLVVYVPFAYSLLRCRSLHSAHSRAISLGRLLAAWVFVHTALLCVIRGSAHSERYWEVPPFGVLSNLLIVLGLLGIFLRKQSTRRGAAIACLLWMVCVVAVIFPQSRVVETVRSEAREFTFAKAFINGSFDKAPASEALFSVVPKHVFADTRAAVIALRPHKPFSWQFYTDSDWRKISLAEMRDRYHNKEVGPLSFTTFFLVNHSDQIRLFGLLLLLTGTTLCWFCRNGTTVESIQADTVTSER